MRPTLASRFGMLVCLALFLGVIQSAAAETPIPMSSQTAQAVMLAGEAKRVRGAAELFRARGGSKLLAPGDRVHVRDRVETGRNGQVLVQLVDNSVFTIGPNTNLTIDEFVFDPNSGRGEAVASVLTGVFRFLSGRIAKQDPDAMTVRVPFGTIGVRGTDAAAAVTASSVSVVLLNPHDAPAPGALNIATALGSVFLARVFDGTTLSSGAAPEPVQTWSDARVRALLAQIGSLAAMPAVPAPGPTPPPEQRGGVEPGGATVLVTRGACREAVQFAIGLDPSLASAQGGGVGPLGPLPVDAATMRRFGVPDRAALDGGNPRAGQIYREAGTVAWSGERLNRQQAIGLGRMCLEIYPGR